MVEQSHVITLQPGDQVIIRAAKPVIPALPTSESIRGLSKSEIKLRRQTLGQLTSFVAQNQYEIDQLVQEGFNADVALAMNGAGELVRLIQQMRQLNISKDTALKSIDHFYKRRRTDLNDVERYVVIRRLTKFIESVAENILWLRTAN